MRDEYISWKDWKREDFGVFTEDESRYFDWHVRRAVDKSTRKLRVLEIGFGNGGFLNWARLRGHEVTGVELSEELVARAQVAGYRSFAATAAAGGQGAFDLIVGFDVLEHIEMSTLQTMLRDFRSQLAPEGRMLFRFPNSESPMGVIYQNGDITHVTRLGVSSMRQICNLTGLKLLHSGDVLPWRSYPLRKRPRKMFAAVVRQYVQWILGDVMLGHPVRIAANEVVVLGCTSTPTP